MTAPISRIGGQRVVTRDAGSDGHDAVSQNLDGKDPHTLATAHPRNKKVEEVAKMYERQFLGEMFKAMRSTVSETDKPSMAQEIYNSQRDDQYIDAWSEQGGIGFSNIIYDQIMERFFGGTGQGQALKKQGMIPLTNREITNVSQVKNGVVTPIVPRAAVQALPATAAVVAPLSTPTNTPQNALQKTLQNTLAGQRRSVENTEPMPAPTPHPSIDRRSADERVAAGEFFPQSATENPNANSNTAAVSAEVSAGAAAQVASSKPFVPSQTALQIEVRPSPTGAPAKIQAPWDATVVQATRLDGSRTAVTLEHGKGLRSTLVFDGVLSRAAQPGQKIPRGESIGTLNADAKSFLWNLATQLGANEPADSVTE